MTRSDLAEVPEKEHNQLSERDIELAVKSMLERMSKALASGERIEIRGFGSFTLHFREPRMGRNPKTGESVALPGRYAPHFKPGKELRERVNVAVDS
jgi:integration host factor subunit beta